MKYVKTNGEGEEGVRAFPLLHASSTVHHGSGDRMIQTEKTKDQKGVEEISIQLERVIDDGRSNGDEVRFIGGIYSDLSELATYGAGESFDEMGIDPETMEKQVRLDYEIQSSSHLGPTKPEESYQVEELNNLVKCLQKIQGWNEGHRVWVLRSFFSSCFF
ncbi:unnamed protein product [Ilex paraguariensis]|uniref:Uncharacterized protein n=1 Tax=Ilex paraguariensis TaxID=185542 RepID=A0ABC8RX24_9AQUA